MNTSELAFFSSPSSSSSTAGPSLGNNIRREQEGGGPSRAEEGDSDGDEQQEERQVEVKGSWGTKIEGIIRCILGVQRRANKQPRAQVGKGKEKINDVEDDAATAMVCGEVSAVKCLVFSQWDDVLLLLSR